MHIIGDKTRYVLLVVFTLLAATFAQKIVVFHYPKLITVIKTESKTLVA